LESGVELEYITKLGRGGYDYLVNERTALVTNALDQAVDQ